MENESKEIIEEEEFNVEISPQNEKQNNMQLKRKELKKKPKGRKTKKS